MANNSSLYGSTPSNTGNISSSNLTTLYSGNAVTVPDNGNLVVPGTLTINGCAILSDCQNFSILPYTPAITIGEAGGTTTILSQLATASYSFPVNDGTSGQVLTTNGSGDLVFTNSGTVGRTYFIGASPTTGGSNFDLVGSDGSLDTIKFAAGTGMTIDATDNSTITFSSTGAITYTQNASSVFGGANLNLVSSTGTTDSVKFASGTGIVVSRTDADTITIANISPGTTYAIDASTTTGGANFNLTGSDATTDTIKFANGSGMSIVRTDANTITFANTSPGTTYTQNASATTGGANLNLVGSDASIDSIKFASGTGITVSRTDADTITITNTAPDTNTTYTQDFSSVAGGTNLNLRGSDASVDTVKFANGTGISIGYTDANTATLTNTGVTSAVAGTGVSVSSATGAVTVSIGQSVATSATPTFAGETLNGALVMNASTSGSVSLSVPAISGSSTMIIPSGNDNLVARNTTDTLTNKTISGVNNTITGLPNSSLDNSSITLGTTTTALGATSLTLGGLTSVAVTQDPVTDLQLATKQYVDTKASTGLTYHEPVHLTTDAPLGTVTYNQPGGAGVGVGATLTNAGTLERLKIDNQNVNDGERILIKDETNQTYNGVYTVTVQGSGSVAWVLTRATDADTYGSNPGQLSLNDYFFTQSGNANKGNAYVLNAPTGTITFGTSNITFAEFSSSQVYTATTPIVITGTDISLTTVPITLGGTGQITANAGLNALLPTQSGNAGRVLYTDGTDTSWTNFSDGFTTGNITIAVADDNTISTTAGDLKLTSATGNLDINAIVNIAADYLNLNSDNTANNAAMRFGHSAEIIYDYTNNRFELTKDTQIDGLLTSTSLNVDSGVLYVDPTNNRVGINNTAPDYEFEISDAGDGFVQMALTNTEREFIITNNAGDDLVSFALRPLPGSSVTNRLQFDAASLDQWFPTGQLGIGTNTPAYELDVSGTGRFTQNVEVGVDAVLGGNIYIDGDTIYNSYNEKWIEYTQYTVFDGSTARQANFQATNNIGVRASWFFIDGRTEFNTTALTTSATTADQVLATFDPATVEAVKTVIRVKSGTSVQCIEVLMVQNGTDISLNTYGDVRTNANLTTVSSGYNSGTGFWELRVTPVNAVTTYTSTHQIMY